MTGLVGPEADGCGLVPKLQLRPRDPGWPVFFWSFLWSSFFFEGGFS